MMRRMGMVSLALLLTLAPTVHADDWPQWLGPQRDGVWRESGILSKFPAGGPKVRWRTPIAGGYAGPAVANGRVYVHDRPADKKRVLCLSEADGKVLWTHEYDCKYLIQYPAGPRCTPAVHEDKVYAIGAMGDLRCLDAADGRLIWIGQRHRPQGLADNHRPRVLVNIDAVGDVRIPSANMG
jgi:hypothetical protein